MSQDSQLVARWRRGDGPDRARAVVRALLSRTALRTLPFLDTHDGRWDLRGLPFPVPREFQRRATDDAQGTLSLHVLGGVLELRDVTLRDVDLSHADARGLSLRRVRVENVLFAGADCRGWNVRGSRFADVDFSGADLTFAALGGGLKRLLRSYPYNEFRRVRFSGANLRDLAVNAPLFEHCDFGGARLDSVDFNASRFVSCTFAGRLYDVHFAARQWEGDERTYGAAPPNTMEGVDFSRAELVMCTFEGIDLRRAQLPADSLLVTALGDVLRALPALARLDGDPDLVAAADLLVAGDAVPPGGSLSRNQFVASVEGLRPWCPNESAETAARLLALMRRLVQQTGTG